MAVRSDPGIRLTDDQLEKLRGIGDSRDWNIEADDEKRLPSDSAQMRTARELFARWGTEISAALLLAALPEAYAAGKGSIVLVKSRGLTGGVDRRVRGTAQFLLVVFSAPPSMNGAAGTSGLSEDGRNAIVRLRVFHQNTRRRVIEALAGDYQPGVEEPINQEDLLGMLLTFSITVFEVLEQFAIQWTAEEQEAYFTFWDQIGDALGIGTDDVAERIAPPDAKSATPASQLAPTSWAGACLRPATVEEGRLLLDRIRARQWGALVDPGRSGDSIRLTALSDGGIQAGRRLIKALLDELNGAMPPLQASWPLALMRALLPQIVRDRLALGNTGLVGVALDALPNRDLSVGRFTVAHAPNRARGMVLRRMASSVVYQALLDFTQAPSGERPLRFPDPSMQNLSIAAMESRPMTTRPRSPGRRVPAAPVRRSE